MCFFWNNYFQNINHYFIFNINIQNNIILHWRLHMNVDPVACPVLLQSQLHQDKTASKSKSVSQLFRLFTWGPKPAIEPAPSCAACTLQLPSLFLSPSLHINVLPPLT